MSNKKAMVVAVMAFCVVVIAATAVPAYAQSVGEIPATGITVSTTGTHVTIDWQDAERATKYLVQIYAGTSIADSLFVTDSILVDRPLTVGVQYTITAIPYWDFRAGAERQLAVVTLDGTPSTTPTTPPPTPTTPPPTPTTPPPTPTTPPPTPTTPPPTPTTPPPTPTTPTDIAGLVSAIEGLTAIITELSQKIAVLEAELAPSVIDEGDFIPIYYGATDPYNRAQKSYFEDQRFLERFTERLTQTMALPYNVYLTMDECDRSNAFYVPDYKQILICYEFVTFMENQLDPYYDTDDELFEQVDEFMAWVMLHELGHALVDVYDLPITGSEEDAVDQFATIIALEYIPHGQLGSNLYPTLLAWLSLGQDATRAMELGGVHSLDTQRFYNVACWMYGSDVHAYSSLAGILPDGRASQCQSEYELMSKSWYRLASPFLLNPVSIPPP